MTAIYVQMKMKTVIVLKFLKIYRDQMNYRIIVHIQAITGFI